MSLGHLVLLSSALLSVGVYGLLTRKQAIGILLSVELMANAANVLLVSFSRYKPAMATHGGGALGQSFALFALAITVAEVAVGLALVILLYRSYGDTRVALARELEG